MDLQPLFDFTRRRKKSLLLLAALGFSGYGLYSFYHFPSVSRKREALVKLLRTLISVADAVSDSAETIGVLSRDLKLFLRSDSDEIPSSLQQLSKIARSEEFSASLARVMEAMTVGVFRAYKSEATGEAESTTDSSFSDRVLDKVFSTTGTGFASVVVGSFARNLVLGFYSANNAAEGLNSSGSGSGSAALPNWVNCVCSDKCRELIGDCIQLFVSTAVAVYLDKTMDINTYDEIFTGLTNPKHESKVKDMLVSIFNGGIETLVKTSHQVLAGSSSNSSSNTKLKSNSSSVSDMNYVVAGQYEGTVSNTKQALEKTELVSVPLVERSSNLNKDSGGWVSRVSSTLAVPSNRRFILDVTGRVTFETVRSFLDFVLWKFSDGLKSGSNVIHGEAVGRGLEVMKYLSAKSVVVATICLALCLHVLVGTRALMPA